MSLLFVYELICFGRVTQAEWEKITEKMHKRYKDIHDHAFSIIDGFSPNSLTRLRAESSGFEGI